jgi:nucleotide-binding universal stress UspA family protein
MTNFIVPVDFSPDSLKGLEWAILFSQKKNINIQMVYVLTNNSHFQTSMMDQEQEFAENQFKKLVDEYEPLLGHQSGLGYIIKKGKVYKEIVNQVNSFSNAVVSSSTHGASGFEELFIGSNALKIMAATDQPVFTLRTTVPTDVKKIVVPIKRDPDTRQKTAIAADLAELFGAELHVISITSLTSEKDRSSLEIYSNQVVNFFKARKLNTITKTLTGDNLANLTCNYAEAVNADLITIMASAVDKWNVLLGSYEQQMVSNARVPLLSITPKENQMPAGFNTFEGD